MKYFLSLEYASLHYSRLIATQISALLYVHVQRRQRRLGLQAIGYTHCHKNKGPRNKLAAGFNGITAP